MDKRDYFNEIKLLEREYFKIIKNLRTSFPKCLNFLNEKKAFFKALDEGKIYNPQFVFEKKSFNFQYVKDLKKISQEIDLSNDLFGFKKLYIQKINYKINQVKCHIHWGEELSTKYALKYRGLPNTQVLEYAHRFCENYNIDSVISTNNKKIFSESDLGEMFKNAIFSMTGKNVKILYLKSFGEVSLLGNGFIRINPNTKFSLDDMKRLLVHEIYVHYLRKFNGKRFKLRILSSGSDHYLETEEGLAVLYEDLNGLLKRDRLYLYAGRALAVNYALTHSFYSTFQYLRGLGFDRNLAFKIVARVKRNLSDTSVPGCFSKDHLYLSGYFKLRHLYEKDPYLINRLFIGKIKIEDLPILKNFIDENLDKISFPPKLDF